MDWEINLGGIRIKSGFIVVFLAFASAVAGGVWTAGELYNRLVVVEEELADLTIPDMSPLQEEIALLEEKYLQAQGRLVVLEALKLDSRLEGVEIRIQDQNIGELQGILAELETNLKNLMKNQDSLIGFAQNVQENKRLMEETQKKLEIVHTEIDDIWTALDELTY